MQHNYVDITMRKMHNYVMPNESKITEYVHCSLCLSEKEDGVSPRDFQMIEAGVTELGFQVWCKRHGCNIINIELNGDKWTWDDSVSLGIAT